jgi:hypothetical protein
MEETAMVRSGRRPLALLAGCLGLAVIAGCAAATSAQSARPAAADTGHAASAAPSASAPRPASPAPSPSASPEGVNVAAFDALARQEAGAWARSPLAQVWRTGLVVLQADDLSSGPSGGFPSGAAKLAFINGDLVFTGPPPPVAPAGVVTWPDGSTMKVPALGEARVFGELTGSRQCPGCVTTPLAVTAARPTTLDVATSRGRASVPAWAFTLKGVSTPVIQAALPPGSYVTPYTYGTPAENVRPLGAAFVGGDPVWPSADGQTLTVGLPASPCDTTWGGLDAEVGGVVVVGGWMRDPNPDQPCAAVLELRKVTVRLAAPLGDRVILDAATGRPVTQEPAPATP